MTPIRNPIRNPTMTPIGNPIRNPIGNPIANPTAHSLGGEQPLPRSMPVAEEPERVGALLGKGQAEATSAQ